MLRIQRKSLPSVLAGLSRKRDAVVEAVRVPVRTSGTWWDGGSKTDYFYVRLSDGARRPSHAPTSPMGPVCSVELVPVPGEVVVETGVFCGKLSLLHVHALPDDLPAVLGIHHPLAGAPVGVVADWLDENGRAPDAATLRRLLA